MPGIDLAQVLVSATVLLLSLTVHEAAHALTADRLGDPTARRLGRVSLNPIVHVDPVGTLLFPLIAIMTNLPVIGWAKPVPVDTRQLRDPRRDFTLVAAAGPASNVAMALAAALAWRLVVPTLPMDADGGGAYLVAAFLYMTVVINVLLALFNLIPVPPLDGGNVLAGLLPPALALQFERLRPWGFLILYALLFSGLLRVLVFTPSNEIVSWLI